MKDIMSLLGNYCKLSIDDQDCIAEILRKPDKEEPEKVEWKSSLPIIALGRKMIVPSVFVDTPKAGDVIILDNEEVTVVSVWVPAVVPVTQAYITYIKTKKSLMYERKDND